MGHTNHMLLFALIFISVASNTFSFNLFDFINSKTPPKNSLHLDFNKPAAQNQPRSNVVPNPNSYLNGMFNSKPLYDGYQNPNAPKTVRTTTTTTTTTTTQRPNNEGRSLNGASSFLQSMFNRPSLYDVPRDRNAQKTTRKPSTTTTTLRPDNEPRSQNTNNNGGSSWFQNYWYQKPSLYNAVPRQQVRSSDTGSTQRPASLQWSGNQPIQEQKPKALSAANVQEKVTTEVDQSSTDDSPTTTHGVTDPVVSGTISNSPESTPDYPDTTLYDTLEYDTTTEQSDPTHNFATASLGTGAPMENTNSPWNPTESGLDVSTTLDISETSFHRDHVSGASDDYEESTSKTTDHAFDLAQSSISTDDPEHSFPNSARSESDTTPMETGSTPAPSTGSNTNNNAGRTMTSDPAPDPTVNNKPFHDVKDEWFNNAVDLRVFNQTEVEERAKVNININVWTDRSTDDQMTTQEAFFDVRSSMAADTADTSSDEVLMHSTTTEFVENTNSVTSEQMETTTAQSVTDPNGFNPSSPRIFEAKGVPCAVPQLFAPCDYYNKCFRDVHNSCVSREFYVGDDVNQICHVMSNISSTTANDQLAAYMLSVQRCINDDLRTILEYPSCDEVTRFLWSALLRKSRVSCWYQGGAFCRMVADVGTSTDLARMFVGASYKDKFMMRLLVTLGEMATYCGDQLAAQFVPTLMAPLMTSNARVPPQTSRGREP